MGLVRNMRHTAHQTAGPVRNIHCTVHRTVGPVQNMRHTAHRTVGPVRNMHHTVHQTVGPVRNMHHTVHQTTGPVRNMRCTAHCTDPHRCGLVRTGLVCGAPGSNLCTQQVIMVVLQLRIREMIPPTTALATSLSDGGSKTLTCWHHHTAMLAP